MPLLLEKFRWLRRSEGAAALAIRSAGARGITLPIQAVASLATAGVLIRHYGTHSYAQYTLVISLVAILPFADLGIGAAVVNASADISNVDRRNHAIAVIRSAFRALIFVAVLGLIVAIVITLSIGWVSVLGGTFDSDGNLTVLACITLFLLTLPLSLGQRVALGIGANDRQLIIQGAQPIITFALIIACIQTSSDIRVTFISFFLAYFITIFIIVIAADNWSGGLIRTAMKESLKFNRDTPNVSIFSTALPMCIIFIGLPLVLQTHRVILSHFGTPDQVAQYSLAAQMYLPVIALVSAASTSLWAVFARDRAAQADSRSIRTVNPMPFSICITLAALLLCAAVTLLVPVMAPLISGGQITVTFTLGLCFSLFVVTQAAQTPLGVYLTDVPGLRLQAVTTLLFLSAVWALTPPFIPLLGAGGPVFVTGVVGVLVQVVPFSIAILYRRRTYNRKHVVRGE